MKKPLISLLLLFLSNVVSASPIFFDDQATFDNAIATASIDISYDRFEGLSNSFPSIYNGSSGLNITSNTSLNPQPASSFSLCADGTDCIAFDAPVNGSSQSFTFDDGSVNAFGIYIGDLATNGGTTLTLETSTGDSQSWIFSTQSVLNKKFFGVINTASAFTSTTLTSTRAGDRVYLDDVQWGASPIAEVPEPSSLMLLGLGLVGIRFIGRKNPPPTQTI